MSKNKDNREDSLNMFDLLKYIIKYYKIIIVTALMGLAIGVVLSIVSYMRGEMSQQYTIKTSIAVTSQNEDGLFTSQSVNPNSNDIYLAEDMVDSVIYVLKSDRTLEEAVDKLQLIGVSAKDIYDNLSLSQYKSTQIVEITLTWRNAEEGIRILEAINEVSPKLLVDILKIGDVRVVNDPKAKYIIGGSINATTWIKATFIGLVLGLGFAVCMMFFKPTLINISDVEEKLGLKLLGEIPKDKHYINKGIIQPGEKLPHKKEINDSYISVSHIAQKCFDINESHIIYITSTENAEGKTSLAANIGLKLADMEKKVLLIDMDLDSPNLGTKFLSDIDYDCSLNSVYQGDSLIDDAIVRLNGYLHILPLIHDDKYIVINETMMNLIKEKSKEYDYTIIDTSAIGNSADVLSLNKIADAAVFVVQYDKAKMKDINEALYRLEKTEIPILGCVVNQVTKLA